ncbi:hypothetical protein HK105_203098 [Polyrhizophydium stewartii]|uniref:Uncharacterized protein n=1 Tax=Polyrhizophydium stewartii TaxID=2732419 RepID=A0ABR4ND32_9FUNG
MDITAVPNTPPPAFSEHGGAFAATASEAGPSMAGLGVAAVSLESAQVQAVTHPVERDRTAVDMGNEVRVDAPATNGGGGEARACATAPPSRTVSVLPPPYSPSTEDPPPYAQPKDTRRKSTHLKGILSALVFVDLVLLVLLIVLSSLMVVNARAPSMAPLLIPAAYVVFSAIGILDVYLMSAYTCTYFARLAVDLAALAYFGGTMTTSVFQMPWAAFALSAPVVGLRGVAAMLFPCSDIAVQAAASRCEDVAVWGGRPIDFYPVFAVLLVPQLMAGVAMLVQAFVRPDRPAVGSRDSEASLDAAAVVG